MDELGLSSRVAAAVGAGGDAFELRGRSWS
jgi:hypothetical protein